MTKGKCQGGGAFSTLMQPKYRPSGGLFLLGAFVSLVVFTSGFGQVFDNERFMMSAFPYIAALAGIGFIRTVQALGQFLSSRNIRLRGPQLAALLISVTFVPHLLLAYDLYPHLLSYYSELIGGAYGAKLLRLETTYWCDTYSEVLSYLNTHAEQGDVIWAECLDVLIYYQLHGRLRPDLQIALGPDAWSAFPNARLNPSTFEDADYVVIQSRQSGYYAALRTWMRTRMPIYEVKYRRLRLIGVYVQQ